MIKETSHRIYDCAVLEPKHINNDMKKVTGFFFGTNFKMNQIVLSIHQWAVVV